MILSYALTKDEYEAGKKSVTRRFFAPRQTALWQKQWDDGKLIHDAWDKVPFAGGKPMVRYPKFMLTTRPYLEPLRDMPEEDLAAEGGMCDTLDEFYALVGKPLDAVSTVLRFSQLTMKRVAINGARPNDLFHTYTTRKLWPVHSVLGVDVDGDCARFQVRMERPFVEMSLPCRVVGGTWRQRLGGEAEQVREIGECIKDAEEMAYAAMLTAVRGSYE